MSPATVPHDDAAASGTALPVSAGVDGCAGSGIAVGPALVIALVSTFLFFGVGSDVSPVPLVVVACNGTGTAAGIDFSAALGGCSSVEVGFGADMGASGGTAGAALDVVAVGNAMDCFSRSCDSRNSTGTLSFAVVSTLHSLTLPSATGTVDLEGISTSQ
jgi:hypothetical protein